MGYCYIYERNTEVGSPGLYSGSMVPQGPRLLLSFYSSILLSMLFPSAAAS